eukprot:scaffold732_cov60-Phaeocystis_antarctica.AAC.15
MLATRRLSWGARTSSRRSTAVNWSVLHKQSSFSRAAQAVAKSDAVMPMSCTLLDKLSASTNGESRNMGAVRLQEPMERAVTRRRQSRMASAHSELRPAKRAQTRHTPGLQTAWELRTPHPLSAPVAASAAPIALVNTVRPMVGSMASTRAVSARWKAFMRGWRGFQVEESHSAARAKFAEGRYSRTLFEQDPERPHEGGTRCGNLPQPLVPRFGWPV